MIKRCLNSCVFSSNSYTRTPTIYKTFNLTPETFQKLPALFLFLICKQETLEASEGPSSVNDSEHRGQCGSDVVSCGLHVST